MANRDTLVKAVAAEIGDSEIAYRAVRAVETAIADALRRGEQVRLQSLGTLRPERVPPRRARNPRTGEAVITQPVGRVRMAAAKALRDGIRDHCA